MSQKSILRAMEHNYRNGHSWDHLDGEAVTKAADEIERLETELRRNVALLLEVQLTLALRDI
jgi:hypothetical protein